MVSIRSMSISTFSPLHVLSLPLVGKAISIENMTAASAANTVDIKMTVFCATGKSFWVRAV